MYKTPTLIILLLISLNSFSQKKKRNSVYRLPTDLEFSIAEENYKCAYRNTYSLEQRLQFYPFNKSCQIMLISYNDTTVYENKTPVKNRRPDSAKVLESLILNELQIDSLTSILYNVGVKSSDFWYQIPNIGGNCYNPRNSIIFLDDKNRVLDYIEICFHCDRYITSSKKIKQWPMCDTKYALLQSYFLAAGIKIGTIEESD